MSISVSSVRVPGCSASAIRVTLPGNVRSGNLRDAHDGIDPGRQSERLVLRHVDLRPDHVALHDGEHERAACRIGLHQAADVDVALGDDAVERGDDALVGLLLIEHLEQGLLRRHVALRNADRGLSRPQGQSVGISLLRGHPTLVDQRAVAVPGHLCEILVRVRLLQGCLVLDQRSLGLGDLVVELRDADLRQQLSCLHPIADVGAALVDVAAGAGIDIRRGKRQGGGRQCDDHGGVAGPHRGHPDARHERATLLGSRGDILMLPIVAPGAESQRADEHEEHPEPKQPAARSAPRNLAVRGRLGRLAIDCGLGLPIKGLNIVHSVSPSNTPWAGLPSLRFRSIANR